jgi:hypothetical protein
MCPTKITSRFSWPRASLWVVGVIAALNVGAITPGNPRSEVSLYMNETNFGSYALSRRPLPAYGPEMSRRFAEIGQGELTSKPVVRCRHRSVASAT